MPRRPAIPPTPQEVEIVVGYAHDQPLPDYPVVCPAGKRLAWALMLENRAFLRPWMVHEVLATDQPLGRRLRRPPEADHPDQRWHIDLMAWWSADRWSRTFDVLDAHRRYLLHWQLPLTGRAEEVTLAMQTAVEPERRRAGEPEIAHDRAASSSAGSEHNSSAPPTALTLS